MNENTLIRLQNLRALGKTPADLTASIGNTKQYWSDMLRGRKSFGETIARRIEEGLELPRLFLDQDHSDLEKSTESSPRKSNHPERKPQEVIGSRREVGLGVTEADAVVHTGPNQSQPIPTSMHYEPRHLKSAVLLIGSLLGALDQTSKEIIGGILVKVALKSDDPEEVEDLAERVISNARVQKPITKNAALNRAIRGKGDPVETGPAPLSEK